MNKPTQKPDLKLIAKQGAIAALQQHIRSNIWSINKTFEGIIENGKYKRLGQALDEVGVLMEDIQSTLNEIQALDPENK